jgi:excinuclease ABC subunit A
LPAPLDEATEMLLDELRARLAFVVDVGLGYLTLDRQSRTLSGGEVQRINLTTALGTSLTNTLFVLDEPSIGLHPSDMHRVIDVMHRLRNAGNSLIVVEHDPQVMLAADRVLDMGPGPGERGGSIVFDGTPNELRRAETLTGRYLGGRLQVDAARPQPVTAGAPKLLVQGAREHNLKSIDVEFPLRRLVCVTGVSGSGKSTLMQDVVYPALAKAKGKSVETPGSARPLVRRRLARRCRVRRSVAYRQDHAQQSGQLCRRVRLHPRAVRESAAGEGARLYRGHVLVQLRRRPLPHLRRQRLRARRNAVFIGRLSALSGLRRHALPSGNAGSQDPARRTRVHIADVLDMTVAQALEAFRDDRDVARVLAPLADVGLDYLKLGQPVPTLSGGEAQRLKLAGFLAEAANGKPPTRGTLFLFDEPTTGLHFDDVAQLMRAFRKLLAAGHSLVVIEHNLDVISAADWLIDLGPEGGDAGGEIVATGTPDQVSADARSRTGQELKAYREALAAGAPRVNEPAARYRPRAERVRGADAIEIVNAREHNLKSIDVSIPRDKFTVITGVSGSGKSTLAFDIVFNEGPAPLSGVVERLRAVDRATGRSAGCRCDLRHPADGGDRAAHVARWPQVDRGDLDRDLSLPAAHLREARAPALPHLPRAGDAAAVRCDRRAVARELPGEHIGVLAPMVVNRKGVYTDLAKWAAARGHSHLRVDGRFVPTAKFARLERFKEHTIELPVADLDVTPANEARCALHSSARSNTAMVLRRSSGRWQSCKNARRQRRLGRRAAAEEFFHAPRLPFLRHVVSGARSAALFVQLQAWLVYGVLRHRIATAGFDAEQSGEEIAWNAWYEGEAVPCDACQGQRLNPTALAVTVAGHSIAELAQLSVGDARVYFERLLLAGRDAEIARDALAEIRSRLSFLEEVGLGYLALDRAAPTLSGGEAQRIRLAAQLGSNLQGVAYVLDEPTIGLHPRDNRILLAALEKLG